MRLRIAALLMALVLLSACKLGPDYARPDLDMPETWSAPREGGAIDAPVALVEWWATLNDNALNSLIERGVQRNLDLRIAEARVREARAARGIAASVLYPTVTGAGSWTYRDDLERDEFDDAPASAGVSIGPGGVSRSVTYRGQNVTVNRSVSGGGATTGVTVTPGGEEDDSGGEGLYQLGFDASWEIDVFGGNRRGIEAADATIEAQIERRRDVLVSLLSEIAMNYIELRAAQSRLDIANKNIAAQANTVRITRARFDAGINSELDAVRAEALLASTQSQLPALETAVAFAAHRLGVLLGEDPGALKDELSTAAPLPVPPSEIPVGLPSDLLQRRPDVRAAERELAAATARIGEATAELYPKFFLTGSLTGENIGLGGLFDSANRFWAIGPGIRFPITRGGAGLANIEVQNARQEQALLTYEQGVLIALEDVENSLVAFAKEQTRRGSLQTAVTANERSVSLANERYIQGLEAFLSVLDAQQQLYQSEDQLVLSQRFVLTNLIALYKALGGGWEIEEDDGTGL